MASKPKNGFSITNLKKLLTYKSKSISVEFLRCIEDPYKREKIEEIILSKLEPQDLMVLLILLTKIPWSVFNSANTKIINHLTSDAFYDSIFRYLKYNLENDGCEIDEIMVLVRFYEILVTYLPICENVYEKLLTLVEITYKCLEKISKAPSEMPIYERLEELLKLLMFKAYYLERNKWHYSDMNIYPSPVDFYENRTLAPNIIKGSYDSTDHYLDLHFKILKEDFICAVREGIDQYRSEISGAKQKKNSSLYLYKNVSSTGISIENNNLRAKICHHITFSDNDKKALQEESFQITKKFMNGSLLFFTRNNFTTFVVATVEYNGEKNDGTKKKFKGIKVSVIGNPYQLKIGKEYDMIEPVTFFEPYHQSLKTIKAIDPYNFSLTKSIIFADIKPISSGMKFSLDNKDVLNPSQQLALEAALSQKFTVIQGPPGTGKSYLARAIIKTLIKSRNPANYPILVVCCRNNALDLVLEPLVDTNNAKIIRLGSQSKSEILTEMTLKKLRKEWLVSCGSKQLLVSKIKEFRNIILDPENINCPDAIETAVQGLSTATESLNCLLQYHDANVVISSRVHVIGATTTGAARYHKMLSYVKPKVVIIEEAAEVMEPLIVSSIPEECDHVILIGDHLQLQPTPAWHPSATKHKMNISLFERMINNGMECIQLKEQHRMRPEIASLISPLIYQDLLNHPSVYDYPDVRGMAKNLFFMDHNIKEDEIEDDSESHWNFYEADFLLSVASYLVKQNYNPSEITILATYAAQFQYLKKTSEKPCYSEVRGVQIQVVDNYQGEENNIILLSLVRSKSPTIGFVARMNRINVAISRAKHGLYIIGNTKTLQSCCDNWKKVLHILKEQKAIGNALPLQCVSHKNITKVSKPEHLFKLEYGGCELPCGFKLKCGHLCPYPCHGPSEFHQEPCSQPCLSYKQCGHKCKAKCFEVCESKPCKDKKSFTLSCGHSALLECSFNFSSYQCVESCNKLMSCGRHRCQNPCFQECGPWPCSELVEHVFPCGHIETVACSEINFYKCTKECSKMSSCGIHKCVKLCNVSCGLCQVLVQTKLDCGHVAKLPCSYDKNDPSTWGSYALYRCSVEVEYISDYCYHSYFMKCYEKNEKKKFMGKCVMGCSQNPQSLCLIS